MEDLIRSKSTLPDYDTVEDLKLNELLGPPNPTLGNDKNARIIHK